MFYPRNYLDALPSAGKLMAIDYGGKRVGIAISDDLRMLATPRETIANNQLLYTQIQQLCMQEHIVAIVVGIPLQLHDPNLQVEDCLDLNKLNQFAPGKPYRNSQLSPNLVNIFNFLLRLNEHWQQRMPIFLENEAYTSADADDFLRENFDLNRKQRTAKLDKIAASYILQRFLQRH